MNRWPLFLMVTLAGAATACSGSKVQTPTSDRNFDDEGAPGQTNDPGASKDGGRDGAAHDAGADAITDATPEASSDAAADAADAASD